MRLKNLLSKIKLKLVIVGPEKPLVDGLVDFLKQYKIKVFGPNKLLLNWRAQKFLQKNYVKNTIFPQLNLVFLKMLMQLVFWKIQIFQL